MKLQFIDGTPSLVIIVPGWIPLNRGVGMGRVCLWCGGGGMEFWTWLELLGRGMGSVPMDMHAYPWVCMHIHRYACISIDMHAYRWICMHIYGYACISVDMHAYLWICIHIHRYACISMDMHTYPWILHTSMDMHAYQWICMHIHGYACISMDVHVYRWIWMHIHQCIHIQGVGGGGWNLEGGWTFLGGGWAELVCELIGGGTIITRLGVSLP